jgi:diaminopimelate epimerase
MRIDFVKMHGLGNDFILVEDLGETLTIAERDVVAACDRHTGIGADGLILVRPATTDGEYYMHYHNADGSLAEMCGNGIRCFAKYLCDRNLVDGDQFSVHTLGGVKPISVTLDEQGTFVSATVDMGAPVLEPERIPVDVTADVAQDCTVETPAGVVRFTAVSMGNPHAVVFVDDVEDSPVGVVGPFLERHELFPHGTNVEFAEVLEEADIRLRVWERGVGETLACGTGACATVVAATLRCEIGREATVRLRGGDLWVYWDAGGTVLMTGPAEEVFTGSIDL